MLARCRTQLSTLSLRPTTNALASRAGVSASFATETSNVSDASEEPVSAFLGTTGAADARIIKTMKKGIRGSPRKLTYLAQQIRGLPAENALTQMKFSRKRRAEVVRKVVQNAVNLADIRYDIEPSNLEIAECFVNKGSVLKRMRPMGKGNTGIENRPYSHLTVVLREFDPESKRLNRHLTKKRARQTQASAETSEPKEE